MSPNPARLQGVKKPEWDEQPQRPELPVIERPKACKYNAEDRTSTLTFADYTGRFYMRGGICWPKPTAKGDRVKLIGHAVLFGLDTANEKLYGFETLEFISIENVLRDGNELSTDGHVTSHGGIAFPGLGPWLNRCWSTYYAETFYYHQDPETHRQYGREIFRSLAIKPKPHIIEIPWQEDEQALFTLRSYVNMGRLKYVEDGALDREMHALQVHQGQVFPPILHAAACAVMGLIRHPYRKRDAI